jgi:serine/threonine-protein kinase
MRDCGMVPSPSPESDEFNERVRARVGTVLKDKWRLEHVLGVGGMAAVYAARHRNGKRVAVKILHREISMDSSVRARFVREGYVANSVGHRLAVSVDDDDVTDDGSAFLVMELLEGETVEARWDRLGQRLPIGDVLNVVDQLLDVLAAAHDKGIIHRDIKPENLFLTRDGQLKVLDFGIARVREISAESTSATRPGGLLGTPAFMAPEQASGRWSDIDPRTDVWAVGATMFTLLSGQWVHEADTPNEILGHAMLTRARSLGTLRDDLPPKLVSIVDKALSYQQSDRWAGARAMRAALAEQVWVQGERPRLAFESFSRLGDVSSSAPTISATDDDEIGSPARTASERPPGTGTLQSAGSSGAREWPRAEPRRGRKFAALLALAAIGVAGVVASIVYVAGRTPAAPPVESARVDDESRPKLPTPARPAENEPTVSPVPTATDFVAPAANAAPAMDDTASPEPSKAVKRTPHATASSSRPTATTPSSKPTATATATAAPPAPTAKSNPLDRRF